MTKTTAQQYLEALLTQHPLPELPPERIPIVTQDLGATASDVVSDLRSRVPELMHDLEDVLPAILKELIREGRLVVGEVGLDSPNAQVIPVGEGQFVVALYSGLFALLYRIARPLASAVFRPAEGIGSGIDMPTLARVVAEIFWWLQQTDDSFGPDYEVTLDQKLLANLLAVSAERFLLAHELGHVYIAMGAMSHAELAEEVNDSLEEHLADVAALSFCVKACMAKHGTSDPTWLAFTYAGAELTLQIWDVMGRIGLDFVDGTHPLATQRIAVLRDWLRSTCDSEATYDAIVMAATVIERAFGEISQIITQPGEHALTFEAECEALIEEFERLLDKCSGERIPDYATFYVDAPALLSRGYPQSVLSRVFLTVVDHFAEAMSKDRDDADPKQILVRFNRFKLLFGLVQQLPEPAKGLYEGVLARLKG
ncbi:hypothetical protein KDW78_15810 [Burkholderia cenocepacia]|uniref:hypothetical protein n=1 Tax=Burkholderia cenocepacia TaxID=95486 RepID=UPI00158E8441|nr:hypothetical protein [Burkholderia cenocepacia]MBR7955345.1 hypothetical protein [Burkholderia cenocepacia]